jgi:hypothetical protein
MMNLVVFYLKSKRRIEGITLTVYTVPVCNQKRVGNYRTVPLWNRVEIAGYINETNQNTKGRGIFW